MCCSQDPGCCTHFIHVYVPRRVCSLCKCDGQLANLLQYMISALGQGGFYVNDSSAEELP